MSFRRSGRVMAILATPVLLQACATKGFVRNEVAVSRAAAESALAAERAERQAADSEMGARLASLRTDLDTLRNEFGVRIAAVEDGLRFAMPVTFAFDDASVRDDARPLLERFARVASRYYPNATITIEGFADPAGGRAYNLALSRRRAENVRDALASLGLSGTPLRVVGYGETRLVTPGAAKHEPGAEANRRVVFVIESASSDALVALGPMDR